MKKRTLSLVTAVLLIFSLTISAAASERAIGGGPDLTIQGTTAFCTGKYSSGNSRDNIFIRVTLKLGSTTVKSWTAEGSGSAALSETWTVKTGKTYTLVQTASVNGVTRPDLIVTATS